ncbi:unnamed protein product [Diatraea saccharalis]|uniref:Uncharacterized protein n=1 Tax=Diatraea saccharalis TaxID=40085 RepID=A0A9N9R0T1_9NEOP|nr:unnamed protein product [Diatraea saccharalis]
MTGEEIPLLSVAESDVKKSFTKKSKKAINLKYKSKKKNDNEKTAPTSERSSTYQTPLRPNFGKLRSGIRKLNCFKGETEDLPIMDIPRHRSIDIGVGLARRMSLFIFTRKTVCVHPYHPYTPSQTTRKIFVYSED